MHPLSTLKQPHRDSARLASLSCFADENRATYLFSYGRLPHLCFFLPRQFQILHLDDGYVYSEALMLIASITDTSGQLRMS
jgi:hypothetical protein